MPFDVQIEGEKLGAFPPAPVPDYPFSLGKEGCLEPEEAKDGNTCFVAKNDLELLSLLLLCPKVTKKPER